MSGHYSSDYPDGFEEKLIAAGAKTQTITPVYRILYDGKLNALNFESTYINYRRRHKTLTKRKLQHLGTYSTSCFLELGDTVRLLRCSMNNPPFAKICKGVITQTSGYSQRTADREPEIDSSHVDWWIYSDIDVNAEVLTNFSIISFEKEGGRFAPVGDRLLVKFAEHDDAWEVCGLYTQELFKSYQNGSPFEEIIKEITDDLNRIKKADIYEKTRVIRDYEKTKPRLFIRLLNADKYSADLQDAVYKTLGDIALVLYMKVTEYEGCVTSTKIRQGMLEQWGKECDEVFQEAILNTYFMSPPRIYRWEQMIFNPEYEGESFMNLGDKCELKKDAMGNCLSTTKKTNGAVAVFLPGVAEQLAYMLDSDFYMVFTSVHEVMIHNDKFVEPEDLQCVLRDTIREATPKEDYLTSRIYQYNRETHKFICVTPLEKDEK